MINHLCVCCRNVIAIESEVCEECLKEGRHEKRILAQETIREIDLEIKETTDRLRDLILRRKIFEKAARIGK